MAITTIGTNIVTEGSLSVGTTSTLTGATTVTGLLTASGGIESAVTRATGATGSFQNLAGDLTYQGAAGGTSTYHAGVMGNFLGDTLTNTNATIHAGTIGKYSVTTSDALVGPKAGLVGEAETSVANAAIMAVLGGDTGTVAPGAAYAVRYLNSTAASKFTYGLDLYSAAVGGYKAVDYGTADIRLQNGETISNATDGGVILASSTGSIIGGNSNSSNPLLKISADTLDVANGVRQGALSVTLNRPSTNALTSWDGNGDIALRVAASNRSANSAKGGTRGMELSARNYTSAGEYWISGIKATAEHSTGTSNIASSTVAEFYMKNNATITTSHYGVLIQDDSQGTSSGDTYGLYINTSNYNPGGGRDAAIKVSSQGTAGWTYGLDLYDATPPTSMTDLRLQSGSTITDTAGVVTVGATAVNFAASLQIPSGVGLANSTCTGLPGRIYLATTDAGAMLTDKVYVCNAAGTAWLVMN